VFIRIVRGSTEVMRARLSDGAVRALTDTPDREEAWPYWSPTSRLLVFQAVAGGEGAKNDLLLWDPERRAERHLTRTPRRDERWPAWSPDGMFLVHAFRAGRSAAGVVITNLATGASTPVASTSGRDFFLRPSFGPGGRRLVAQRRGEGGQGSQLWILAPSEAPQPLTSDPAWFDMKAQFTRDGSRVLFSRRPAAGGPHDIVSIAADGSGLRTHASRPDSDDNSATPSPERDEFAFVSDRAGNFEVWVADFEGDRVQQLTHTPDINEFAPRWSPDGERLAVIASPASLGPPRLVDRERLADARVVVLDRTGRVLFDAPGYNPDWMPPGPSRRPPAAGSSDSRSLSLSRSARSRSSSFSRCSTTPGSTTTTTSTLRTIPICCGGSRATAWPGPSPASTARTGSR
jgi:Tol biopolymer transport system component